jgi:hypothetical protein
VLSNDIGTDRSEVALGQIPPSRHHAIFYRKCRAVRRVGGRGSIRPIGPIQTLAFGPLDPEGYRGDANVVLLRDRSQRLPPSNRRYHVPTLLQLTLCLLKAFLRAMMVEHSLAFRCSGGCGTKLFGRLWHLSDHVLR